MSGRLMVQLNMDGGGDKGAFRKTMLCKTMVGIVDALIIFRFCPVTFGLGFLAYKQLSIY